MNRRFFLTALGCLVAFLAVADGPTDNLRADYRNAVYTNGLGTAKQNNVSLGIGAGYRWASAPTAANWHSSIGVPITAVSANKFLGEPLTPPANWDGSEPTITADTGGIAVWVDFAHAVFTAQAGPIEVRWRLNNGSYVTENSVVSASPSKRPVRLYWTHQRPPYIYDQTLFKPLQNAGPTVSFGSNYKVHLYGTRDIKVLYASGGKDGMYVDTDGTERYYDQNDGNGYVRLDGGELQALEGSRGTFLIIYSRLDEALNERVMLAYELVEVLEPTQTQIDVGIGDQLKPMTRTFDTNELFPMVTRGLTDDADNGEIYVYQHMAGRQKNYLWAIRDSHENPWKIEVYWRAKEELDVVWPFEVDIYSASWKDANAQLYLRNPEGHENGEVEVEPKVLIPGSVTVEAMDYQVPRTHVHVESGAFYTDYAATNTYALLKYTAGETVWFQTVKSVPHTSSVSWAARLAQEIVPESDFRWDGAEDGFFYPGWIRRDFRTSNPKTYPIVNAFNPAAYRYPAEWAPTNSLNSQIFPVNIGQMEVWWSKLSNLSGEIREGSGHVEKLSTPIFFPTAAYLYSVRAPNVGKEWDNVTPQIVLASGLGSAGWSLNDTVGGYSWDYVRRYDPEYDEWYWDSTIASKALHLNIDAWSAEETDDHPYVGYFTTTVPGSGTNESFTVENWMSFLEYDSTGEGFNGYRGHDIPDGVGWISLYAIDAEGGAADEPHLSLRVDGNANIWVNGEKKTAFTEIPNPLFNRGYCIYNNSPRYNTFTNRAFHVALARDGGKFTYYVNGMPAAEFAAGDGEVVVGGDQLVIFPRDDMYDTFYLFEFHGDWRMFRLWKEARSHKQIYQNRYLQLDPVSTMLLQYGDQEFIHDRTSYEDGVLVQNTLVDSSANRRHASYGFFSGTVAQIIDEDVWTTEINQDAYKWIRQSVNYSAIPIPVEGRTFPPNAQIYRQTDPEQDGYNPNEEHAFMVGNVAYALRCDLNQMGTNVYDFSSLPYVLVQYANPSNSAKYAMTAIRVVPENDMYRFRSFLDAGSKIQSVSPLDRLQPANLHKFISGPLYAGTQECFKDRKDWYWAHQAGDDGGTTNYVFEFSYPHQEQFDYPNGDAPEVGATVGFMEGYTGRDDFYLTDAFWGNLETGDEYDPNHDARTDFIKRPASDDPSTPIDYTFIVKWPDDVKGLYVNDTLIDAKDGLPAIAGQLSAKVVYEQSMVTNGLPSVRLIDPTRIQYGSLKELPDAVRNYRDAKTNKTKFNDLPPLLRDRLVWNPMAVYDLDHNDTRELELSGKIIRETSYTYAWLNVMDARSKDVLTNPETFEGGGDSDWSAAITSMPGTPVEITDDTVPFDSLALATTGKGAGYVTLVMNNSTNEEMVAKSEVVTMYVIKVVPELYSGYLHPIQSDNPLDLQMNMKYTSDFGGTPEQWEFEWKYCEPVNGTWNSDSNQWFAVGNTSPGTEMLDWITIGDAGIFGLSDHYVRCRYRAKEGTDAYNLVGGGWSKWSTPCLAEGWIKRVLKAINPFEQRIKDYYNTAISTDLSMIQQAGAPYNGDIPLNLEALNENGLISIYETVLRQARKLSIDSDKLATGSLALALQMAAGRIAELYMVLGNEALADAMNPTVDLGKDSPVDDGAESSIFPFQNQCENLLDEELALLRGRDLSMQYERAWSEDVEPWAYPYYNRLQWNFTHDVMGGHVAYTLNYGIKDIAGPATADDPSKPDGSIDVYDAQKLYPQGHGDAYGHYLSAVKGYYSLLRHPSFGWYPQIESILAGTVDIMMSYFHEKRFALAAQAKAKTAAKIVADTYRQNYVAGIEDPWMEAEDESEWRAWGTDEWATRGHLGAYYDWLAVNALLPTREAEDRTLVKMLDRESTYELGSLASSAKSIQSTADYADIGLNPLGLADNAIPFDISPSEIDAGKTHFEQIAERAEKAVKVAHDIFKRAKKNANALRDQNENADFEHTVADEEAAIDRRLKEIYGYPYADDIGVGKLYEQGYDGPDLYHYNYIETYDLDNSGHEFGRYYDVLVNDYRLITTNCVGTFVSDAERMEADYGPLGNMVAGAITWWQQYMPGVAATIDPYLAYGGISSSTNYLTLPVTIIDTGEDHLDGKVDYNFAVAAWSNAAFYASYYVGAYGFTPKPASYKGQRRAEGEVQIALTDYAAQLAAIEQEAKNVEAAATKLQGLIDELTTKDYDEQMGYVTEAAASEVQAYNDAVKKNAATIEKTLNSLKDIKSIIAEVATEALPKVVGVASDLSSLGRAALLAIKQAAHELLNSQVKQQQDIIAKAETEAEKLQQQLNEKFTTYQANEERQKMVNAINEQIPVFKAALAKLEVTFNTANATRMKYAKLEAEGDELQNERERLRIQWAADLAQKRYRNMMYQILRDDELQRYNEAFELATKYTFLAAKAYDYETGLLQSDSTASSGSQFLSEIVRSRALGRFSEEGEPLGGGSLGDPGLADILYRMNANWSVLKTRLGFNNAQTDIDSFSLRQDLFGRSGGVDGDTAWRNDLASCWCDDLRTHPAFAVHCQPFDPMQDAEPGFAIPFSTVIAARKDLFGNDLMGGSTAYSSTYFATKLRAVGVWLETAGANAVSLPTRPEVYLVPCGLDYMRVPIRSSSSAVTAKRTWQVVDQTIPVPYSLTDSDWESADWSALKDVCANELCNVRRHPAIRAQVGTAFDAGTLTYNARLIGRSVWNDQWYIFIPAASVNANNARARAAFLDAVKDIHLNLKTYSLSGN